MKNVLFKIIILFGFTSISGMLYSQNMPTQKDSLRANNILDLANIDKTAIVSLNQNGLKLKLTAKEAEKIAKVVLYSTYGKFAIIKQKPFHIVKIDIYWIM